jgi:hypothetical protein
MNYLILRVLGAHRKAVISTLAPVGTGRHDEGRDRSAGPRGPVYALWLRLSGERLAYLPDDLEALAYRFYVNEGVRMTLERAVPSSATAVPADN